MMEKVRHHIDSKYETFVELILQVTLFGIDGLMMAQIVKKTGYTEQSVRSIIKKINKEYPIIKIDKEHKPYKYAIDVDMILAMN